MTNSPELYYIHVPDFQQINLTYFIDYQISQDNRVSSENKLLLYGLSLLINKKFGKKQFSQIQSELVSIEPDQRQTAILFLNKIAFTQCVYIADDVEAAYLIKYMKNENQYDFKFIIKFIDEIDQHEFRYICAYFQSEKIFALLNNFSIAKVQLPQDYKYRKQLIESEVNQINVYTQEDESEMYVYGIKKNVEEFVQVFGSTNQHLQVHQYDQNHEQMNNKFNFIHQKMNEDFRSMKTFESENKIHIYIKTKSASLLQEEFKYKIIENSVLRHLFDFDKTIHTFLEENPHFIKSESEDKVVGNPFMVDRIAKQLQFLMNHEHAVDPSAYKYSLEQFKSIQVDHKNHRQFLELCKQFKNTYPFEYRMDLGQVRITNYAKQCSKLYIVFRTFDEIINLQSVIHEQIELTEIKYIIDEWDHILFPNVREIKSKNERLTIVLYPWIIKSIQQLFDLVKNSPEYLKTVVCPKDILQEFLKKQFDFNITFVINQHLPSFQFIKAIKQIEFQVIKCPSLERELRIVKGIYLRDLRQYQNIEQYKISPIDSYNITDAIIHERKKVQIFLAREYKKQMLYLTYYSKLFQVLRNQKGEFMQFIQASLQKDLPKINESEIKTIIKKAFITGQTYVCFYLPFQRVKLLEIQEGFPRPKSNANTLLAWNAKLFNEGEQLLKICSHSFQYIQNNFSKIYKLVFSDEEILKFIKDFRMGYGHLQRFKNGKYIGIQLSAYICRQVLKKIQNL